ncbi:MAG: GTPase ObgE [Bifidobacteriaceae bacterium]|jgi:GTP-binding protein|nr:GTPase ObgE [Bifidobacteriaceae bacterium]
MTVFIDKVIIHVKAGDGGKGCVAVRREKYKPLAGPNGGNGGNGGSIIFIANHQITTLLDYKYNSHMQAKNGQMGKGSKKDGITASDLILPVPLGTIVKQNNKVVADLNIVGKKYIAAQGGIGGLGNAALANKNMISPKFALLGTKGEEKNLVLELKIIADVGLIGFPSSGKSSLISAISAAKPKIANYPFTTLVPNLGVVNVGDDKFTVADVPGLIPGASKGKGMGYEFLRHIERVFIIAHVLDLTSTEPNRNPLDDIKQIEKELKTYGNLLDEFSLKSKLRIIILNKIDVIDNSDELNKIINNLKQFNWQIFPVSAVTHQGLDSLLYYLASKVSDMRQKQLDLVNSNLAKPKIINIPDKEAKIKVQKIQTKNDYYYRISGRLPELWAKQIDWDNEDAVSFFSNSLDKLGAVKQLKQLDIASGDKVKVGGADSTCIFNWIDELL